jgi:hypothetical protein
MQQDNMLIHVELPQIQAMSRVVHERVVKLLPTQLC